MNNPGGRKAGLPKLPALTSAADGTEPRIGVERSDLRSAFAVLPDDVDGADEDLAWVILLVLIDDLLADFASRTPRRRVKRQRNARHCCPFGSERTAVAPPKSPLKVEAKHDLERRGTIGDRAGGDEPG
jgi:hypothetical protein